MLKKDESNQRIPSIPRLVLLSSIAWIVLSIGFLAIGYGASSLSLGSQGVGAPFWLVVSDGIAVAAILASLWVGYVRRKA